MVLLGVLGLLLDVGVGATAPEAFLEEINAARSQNGEAPLRLSAPLSRLAQTIAERIADADSLESATPPAHELMRRARRGGYEAAALAEVVTQTHLGPRELVQSWRERDDDAGNEVLDHRFRDLGVGTAQSGDRFAYALVLALSAEDDFAARTEELRDAERVRADLLRQVNRERASRRLAPVRASAALERAAQRYADDMLARDFYGHVSPEGAGVSERARSAGYALRSIGENIARGQDSVALVMKAWMGSSEHRANILSPLFTDAGFGIALGKTADGWKVFWVQVFGRPL